MNSQSHQDKPMTVGIIRHFPKLKAAEHEVVSRISDACLDNGWIPRVIDVDSKFDFKNINQIEADLDAVLDIHYEYPKFLKAKSYGAVWTPTSFMKDWDLPYVWENQISHDFLLHSGSSKIDKLISKYREESEFGIINHSIPASWISWIDQQERNSTPIAFYAGINWTKLTGRPGRHNDFFREIDDLNIVQLYGPKKVSHIEPWKGFKSYKGEIPFDGKTILTKARAAGISLVLSAQQHINEEIISSRLFEAMAAGNAIIADKHPFIVNEFGNNALYLDFDKGYKYAAQQLQEYVNALRVSSVDLGKLQDFARNIFLEKYDLSEQLKLVFEKKTEIDNKIDNLTAIVIGNSRNNIIGKLRAIGITKVDFIKNNRVDLQDLLETAEALGHKRFLVLNGNIEILDGFSNSVKKLLEEMDHGKIGLGLIPTVALSQDSRNFSPVVMSRTRLLPLNGLVLITSNEMNSKNLIKGQTPLLRITNASEMTYIQDFVDTYEFLSNVSDSLNGYNSHVRYTLSRKLKGNEFALNSDIAEEIRIMPKTRKKVAIYSLLAAVPGTWPIAKIVKFYLRRTSKL